MKKLLALVLALVMTLSLCVTSNAAFADAADIEHDEAVEAMSTLGVINGKGDNKFDPKGNVTRAEMAKMITIVMLGDVDAAAFVGTTTDLKDVNGHWAEGYIKYCYSQGVIAGKGNGIFAPNDKVTALEAAKMLLVAIGYNATVQGYVGGEWAINVVRDAQLSGFYDELKCLTSGKVLSRDEAAQMIYNAIGALLIEKSPALNVTTGALTYSYKQNTTGKTLLSETFDAVTKYGYITDVTYDSNKAKYTYTVSNGIASTSTIVAGDLMANFSATVDYTAFMGMKSKVVYKVVNNDIVVYGVSTGAEKVVSAKGADITIGSDKVTVDKKDYKAESTISVYAAGGYVGTLSGKNEAYLYDLYDVDGDGKIEIAVTAPFTFGKVTFMGSKSVTVQAQGGASTAYDLKDISYYDGMAKNDYVLVTAAANTAKDEVSIAKVELTTGKASATKGATDVQVDGTWYKYTTGAATFLTTASVNDEVEYAAVNGYVFAMEKVNGTSVDNILYVVATESGANTAITPELGKNPGDKTSVLLPDGTAKTVNTMRVDVKTTTTGTTSDVKVVPAPGLYTYKVNSDDVYELKAVKEATTNAAVGVNYVFDAANKPLNTTVETERTVYYDKGSGKVASKLDGKLIADDAVIYLASTVGGETKTKVVSGATMKTMASWGSGTYHYITKNVNGMPTVIMAYLTHNSAISGSSVDTAYGYVTSAGYFTKKGDDGVIKFTVWNGTEEVELTDVTSGLASGDTANAKYAKGAFVTYTTSATVGEVTGVTAIATQDAVTGYDNGYNINLATTGALKFKDDNKSVIIYVDSANTKGVEGGSIALAQEVATGSYVKNVVVKNTAGEVDVLFVDVANKLSNASYTVTTVTATANTTNGITLTPAVKVDGTTLSSGNTVAAGKTITVEVAPTGTEDGTATYAKTATVVLTRADGVTETKTMSFTCAQNTAIDTTVKSVTFTMPDMGVTSIVVTFA